MTCGHSSLTWPGCPHRSNAARTAFSLLDLLGLAGVERDRVRIARHRDLGLDGDVAVLACGGFLASRDALDRAADDDLVANSERVPVTVVHGCSLQRVDECLLRAGRPRLVTPVAFSDLVGAIARP